MEYFAAGRDVKLSVNLKNDDDIQLASTSYQWRVLDENGTEILGFATVTLPETATWPVDITVPAINNTLGASVARGLRTLEVLAVTENGTKRVIVEYIIEASLTLIYGTNSYITLGAAELRAAEMMPMIGWTAADNRQKIAAMAQAYKNIGDLSFRVWDPWNTPLSVAPAGGLGPDSIFATTQAKLSLLTAAQLNTLDPIFMSQVKFAQVAEADFLLGGDPTADIRASGVMNNTVGEASQMFRSGKPLEMMVCKRAMRYLTGYVIVSPRVTRT